MGMECLEMRLDWELESWERLRLGLMDKRRRLILQGEKKGLRLLLLG